MWSKLIFFSSNDSDFSSTAELAKGVEISYNNTIASWRKITKATAETKTGTTTENEMLLVKARYEYKKGENNFLKYSARLGNVEKIITTVIFDGTPEAEGISINTHMAGPKEVWTGWFGHYALFDNQIKTLGSTLFASADLQTILELGSGSLTNKPTRSPFVKTRDITFRLYVRYFQYLWLPRIVSASPPVGPQAHITELCLDPGPRFRISPGC